MDREILTRLEEAFPPEKIRTRKARGGKELKYIDTASVVQRLNDVLDGNWSFEVVENRIEQQFIVVLGRLRIDSITKMQFGGKSISYDKSGEVIDIGDDFKAAVSDCLKKCASHFGVGLSLYVQDAPDGKAGGNGGGDKGTKPEGKNGKSLGDIKTTVSAKEKDIEEAVGKTVNQMRKDFFKSTALPNDINQLRKYYSHLNSLESAEEETA